MPSNVIERFTLAMELAVAEMGSDYIYPNGLRLPSGDPDGFCQYVIHGKGACVIGRACIKYGVDPDVLHSWEGQGAFTLVLALFKHMDLDTKDEERLAYAAAAAQFHADAGGTSGAALDKFKQVLAGH
jgi:hypothetical protein